MQYIPCNSALLAQEALFLPKKALFMPKDLQKKVRKSRQIFHPGSNIAVQQRSLVAVAAR